MNQMPHLLTLIVIFQLKVPEVAATIAGISRTEDMNPVSDAGNAGLPCVWSLGIPPHLSHHALNATTRNVFNSYLTCTLYSYSYSQLHFQLILKLIRHYISHLLSCLPFTEFHTLKSLQLSLNNGIPLSSLILDKLTPSTSSQNFEISNKRHQTIVLRFPGTMHEGLG